MHDSARSNAVIKKPSSPLGPEDAIVHSHTLWRPEGNAVVPLSNGQPLARPLKAEPPGDLIASVEKSVNELVR